MINMQTHQMLIGGKWKAAKAEGPLYDPSTGKEIARIALDDAQDVDDAVRAAGDALQGE